MQKTRLSLFFLLLNLPATGYGEELELIGDRPDFTESNAAVAAGHLQAELGVEAAGADDDLEVGVPRLLLRYGVVDDFELRLEVPDLVIGLPEGGDADAGAGAAAAGLKWVHSLGDSAAAGLIFMVGSPVTRGDFDAEGLSATLNGVWGVDFTDRLSLGGNVRVDLVGLGIDREEEATMLELTASLALGIGLTDRVGLFLETFQTVDDNGGYTPNADAGFTFLVTPRLQLDAYGGADVSNPVGGWFAGAGVIALF